MGGGGGCVCCCFLVFLTRISEKSTLTRRRHLEGRTFFILFIFIIIYIYIYIYIYICIYIYGGGGGGGRGGMSFFVLFFKHGFLSLLHAEDTLKADFGS